MGTPKNRLAEAVLTSTHSLRFEQKYEKYQKFLSKNFQFLEVNLSIYLNRRVFVMTHAPKGDNNNNFNNNNNNNKNNNNNENKVSRRLAMI